jgi:hypothetical protein
MNTLPSGAAVLAASSLHHAAGELYKGLSKDDDLMPGSPGALAVILLSAASMEGFVNELGVQAKLLTVVPSLMGNAGIETAALLADVLAAMEDSRGSLEHKLQVARRILCGASFDTGRQPFQDFVLLVEVRNFLMHLKVTDWAVANNQGDLDVQPSRLLLKLRSKGIIAASDSSRLGTTVDRLSTRAAARWAGRTCAATIQSFRTDVPDGVFGDVLRGYLAGTFAPSAFDE